MSKKQKTFTLIAFMSATILLIFYLSSYDMSVSKNDLAKFDGRKTVVVRAISDREIDELVEFATDNGYELKQIDTSGGRYSVRTTTLFFDKID